MSRPQMIPADMAERLDAALKDEAGPNPIMKVIARVNAQEEAERAAEQPVPAMQNAAAAIEHAMPPLLRSVPGYQREQRRRLMESTFERCAHEGRALTDDDVRDYEAIVYITERGAA